VSKAIAPPLLSSPLTRQKNPLISLGNHFDETNYQRPWNKRWMLFI
jgi:hypothetical protein